MIKYGVFEIQCHKRDEAEKLIRYFKKYRLKSYMGHIYGFLTDRSNETDEGFIVTTEIFDYIDEPEDVTIAKLDNEFNGLYKRFLKESGLGLSGEYYFHIGYYDVAHVEY